jgi:hypothetical protein
VDRVAHGGEPAAEHHRLSLDLHQPGALVANEAEDRGHVVMPGPVRSGTPYRSGPPALFHGRCAL